MLNAIWEAKVTYQEIVLLGLVALAAWRGAAPERSVAGIFVWLFVSDRLYHLLVPSGWHGTGVDLGHLAIDLSATGMAWVLALKANRVYPLCFGALQLAALIAHLSVGLNPSLKLGTYGIVMIAPSYLQMVVFALGLAFHYRRQAKFGPYPSWRES